MTLPSSTENWASCDPAPESVTVSFGRGNEKHLSSSLLTLTQLAFYREKLKFSSRVHGHDHAPFRGPAPGPCHDHGSARISSCPCYGLCHRKAAYAGHQCPWSWPSSGGTSTLSVMLWPYACLSLSGWLTVDVALLRESEASECHQELLAFRHHQHHLLIARDSRSTPETAAALVDPTRESPAAAPARATDPFDCAVPGAGSAICGVVGSAPGIWYCEYGEEVYAVYCSSAPPRLHQHPCKCVRVHRSADQNRRGQGCRDCASSRAGHKSWLPEKLTLLHPLLCIQIQADKLCGRMGRRTNTLHSWFYHGQHIHHQALRSHQDQLRHDLALVAPVANKAAGAIVRQAFDAPEFPVQCTSYFAIRVGHMRE
eukprot:CAMPEP_0172787976 /NCGR_PEP_ID=MMETSP1074-20121228/206718_1 /TAXON_ID=2916 /ORGANISM="Ceratium fusus, Strain PA161109" /LENGTH=369 /DNA_ID=CAMNT_0013624997 /DNA_START=677 /DNA_END=1789 /DNA_ORIENTATION=+